MRQTRSMQRDCRMTKPTNTQSVRGGEVKRMAETARVSRNSMRSNRLCWGCGKEGHISHCCTQGAVQCETEPKEKRQEGNLN
jgi:hypothetical protein